MSKLLPLQVYQAKDYNGLVTDNHFYSLYQQEPQLIDKTIHSIYKMNLQTSLREFVNRFPVDEVEQENGFYQWMLQGQFDKNLPLVDAVSGTTSVSAGTFPSEVGANGQRFYIFFDEGLFEETNVLKGETDDYHLYVHKAEQVGSRYRYEVQLQTHDPSLTVPAEELVIGRRFSKFYDLVPSTLSYKGAKPWFTSPFMMENRLSTMRMEYEVPGNVINKGGNEPLRFPFKDKNGEIHNMWINYQDMVAHYQCEEMFARMCLYGKRNWNGSHQYFVKDDKTKYNVESGEGFFGQIDPGNKHYYNSYDIEWHMEIALDMGIGKTGRGDRHVHVITGERGAIEIHKQIEAKGANRWTVVADNLVYNKTKPGNIGNPNTLGYGYQFNEYNYVNGIKLTVEIMDFLDDDVYFPARDPEGKGIVRSHRMITLGFGEDAGIRRVKPKGTPEMNWGYIAGMRDPFTAAGKGQPKSISTPVDGYSVHFQKWGGIKVTDPTKIIDMQKAVER